MDDKFSKDVDEMEQHAKYTIITLDDDQDEKKKILDEAKDEMTRLYFEFKTWLSNNIDSDEVKDRLECLKQETANLIARTKRKLQEFTQREDIQGTYEYSKQKFAETKDKISDHVSDGVKDVMRNEYVNKAITTVHTGISTVCHDERVQGNVRKLKKGTLKVAQSAFDSLKRVLDTDDDKQDDSRKGQ